MPELPEVETICRALDKAIKGRKIIGVKTLTEQLREPLNEKKLLQHLQGRKIRAIKRRAKFMFFDMGDGHCLIAHLGMTGSFRVDKQTVTAQKHDRAVFLLDKKEKLVYHDIRKFGSLSSQILEKGREFPQEYDSYGPEPLEDKFTTEYFFDKCQKSRGPIKPFIMKQEVVVGIGNIYASEALFMAGINPQLLSGNILKKDCKKLIQTIKKVLENSIKQGGTTISDYRKPDGSEGKFALRLKVYGREGEVCRKKGCKGIIKKIKQAGRSTFYCPVCQK